MSDAPAPASPDQPVDPAAAPGGEPPKGAMRLLILIAMLDLFGFGLIIPLLPFYIPGYQQNTIEQNLKVFILFSIYSICQFVGAPVLGLMSDRFGRRPVLALSQIGSAIGYLLLGVATVFSAHPTALLTIVYLSRIIDGFTGGNISTVQAYIADVTTPKNRAKWMGMLGAAFGVGFVLGPTAGGILGHIHPSVPAYVAMAVSGGAGVLSWILLPESRHRKPAEAEVWLHPGRFAPVLRQPVLRQLLAISFFIMAAFVMMESSVGVFLARVFHYTELHVGLFFGFVGIIIIGVQGGAVGRLTKNYGEWPLAALGPGLVALGMFGLVIAGVARIPFSQGAGSVGPSSAGFVSAIVAVFVYLTLYGGAAVNAAGRSLQQPTISSLVSQYSRPEEHGAVFGLFHGLGSLARTVGPLAAAPAARFLNTTGQFLVSGMVAAVMAYWTYRLRRVAGAPQHGSEKELDVPPTSGEPHGVTAEPG